MTDPSESEIRPTTILVDVQLQRTDANEHDASLQELRQLVETLEWKIVGALTQKMSSLNAASLIGPGKLEELSQLVKTPLEVDSVVFDHDLTTTQVRNIREATDVDVYDRSAIILEIFHRHGWVYSHPADIGGRGPRVSANQWPSSRLNYRTKIAGRPVSIRGAHQVI